MVDFVQLQKIMKDRLEQDRKIRIVTASGATLEDAVAEAAVLLDLPVRRLEYEVTEKGAKGILGTGKKGWTIKAYERLFVRQERAEVTESDEEFFGETPVVEYADGDVFLHLYPDGVFLKVVPPKGSGRRVSVNDAINLLGARDIDDFDEELVHSVVREAASRYIRVGNFEHRIIHDSAVAVEISEEVTTRMGVPTARVLATPACGLEDPPGGDGLLTALSSRLRLISSACIASCCSRVRPREIRRFTVDPPGTEFPAVRLWLITLPLGTVS